MCQITKGKYCFFPESQGIGLVALRPGAMFGWLWQTSAEKRSFTRQNAEYTSYFFLIWF